MATNKRLYFAVYQAGIAECGTNSFTSVHGLQSVGVNTRFNLLQVFEVGQLSLYELAEQIPDVEVTMEKVLDGYPLLYHLATKGAVTGTLAGRSNRRATVGVSIYSDAQDSASGTPLNQCTISGVYVSALNYNFQVDGNFTESVTLVGNNRTWLNTFSASAFNNTDQPLAVTGSGGVQQRQDMLFGVSDTTVPSATLLPPDIPGIASSGTNIETAGQFAASIRSIRVSANLGRDALYELGRRGPYHRFVQFPVEVRTDIEFLDKDGDRVEAIEDATSNLTDRKIYLMAREGTKIDLGTKNKLQSVNWGGANAGQNGGNATCTFSYINYNDLKVVHPQDPSGLS